MTTRNNFHFQIKIQNLKKTKAKYFLPYASSFRSKLEIDNYIEKNNLKIDIKRYKKAISGMCKIIHQDSNSIIEFLDGKIIREKKIYKKSFRGVSDNKILNSFKKEFSKIDIDEIREYFCESKFKDAIILFVSLTNDSFNKNYLNFYVDFSGSKILIKFLKKQEFEIKDYLKKFPNKNIIYIKARKEAFNYTIKAKSSWEDLGIGFQIRVQRFPNDYNYKFVEHFQYKYLSPENKKTSADCSACTKFLHLIDKHIAEKNLNF